MSLRRDLVSGLASKITFYCGLGLRLTIGRRWGNASNDFTEHTGHSPPVVWGCLFAARNRNQNYSSWFRICAPDSYIPTYSQIMMIYGSSSLLSFLLSLEYEVKQSNNQLLFLVPCPCPYRSLAWLARALQPSTGHVTLATNAMSSGGLPSR